MATPSMPYRMTACRKGCVNSTGLAINKPPSSFRRLLMPSSPAKHYILAHQTSTGGDKAVVTDLQGQVIQSAYQSYNIYYPRPEWAEQDTQELWQTVAATTP